MKAKFIFLLMVILSVFSNAQNEFITVWKPGTSNEIKFPGRGSNFTVIWEEIGHPAHNGILTNVNSTRDFIINIGTSSNPNPANATYKVKISNGNGQFDQIRFFDSSISPIYSDLANASKIIDIEQWGNIEWKSMSNAFVFCINLDVSATDSPNLSQVTTADWMFYVCASLVGTPSFNNWDTSSITNMYYMFGDTSVFNQPLDNWDVSNVTNFAYMFDVSGNFNQPLAKWDVSNATSMEHMFHGASSFNQPIGNWNTAKVTNMEEMFNSAATFNQNIADWNTGKVTDMSRMFLNASQFNQNLGQWNLGFLSIATNMFLNSNLNCQNYDNTLYGWNQNPNTPNNINLGNAAPLIYSNNLAVNARTNLINNRGWTINGDLQDENCQSTILSTVEIKNLTDFQIYPNPTSDFLNIKTSLKIVDASIVDVSGRLLLKINNPSFQINIAHLPPGNYILQLTTNEGLKSFKFIKK